MRTRRPLKRDVKALTMKLLRKEYGDNLAKVDFSGPFEEEDLDVDVYLHEEPPDNADRIFRVWKSLSRAGYDVPIYVDLVKYLYEEDI
jgi:hypothetical protein